jgi:hypothetical protein
LDLLKIALTQAGGGITPKEAKTIYLDVKAKLDATKNEPDAILDLSNTELDFLYNRFEQVPFSGNPMDLVLEAVRSLSDCLEGKEAGKPKAAK